MKYIFLVFGFLTTLNVMHAQEVSSDWFYKNGQIVKKFNTINAAEMTIPAEGINMIWDFSNATAASLTDTLYEFYVAAESLADQDQYPNADVGRIAGPLEFYFDISEDAIILEGLFVSEFVSQSFPGGFHIGYAYGLNEPKERAFTMLGYNHNTMDTIATVDGLSSTLELVGTGTVITPDGSYDNCVFQKRTRVQNDEVILEVFEFFKDQYSNQLIAFSRSFNQNTNQFDYILTYQTDLDQLLSNNQEIQNIDWNVFFGGNKLHIISEEEYSSVGVQLFDMSGRLVQKNTLSIQNGANVIEINQATLQGQYVVFVLDKTSGNFRSFMIWI